jgi:hypothetical protein
MMERVASGSGELGSRTVQKALVAVPPRKEESGASDPQHGALADVEAIPAEEPRARRRLAERRPEHHGLESVERRLRFPRDVVHVIHQGADRIIAYMKRLPQQEFAAFIMKDAINRDAELKKSNAVRQWVLTEGKALIL